MEILKTGETLVAKESDYSSGSIGWFGSGVNDAYDLYLVENSNQEYIVIIYMDIQFIFSDSKSHKWTEFDKKQFVRDFKSAINTKWGNKREIKALPSGKKIYVDFRFGTQIGGWSLSEHWEIHVKKIPSGSFHQSYVQPLTGHVQLDSEDLNFSNKKHGIQRGVVHEFGHMIGLDDEYEVGAKHEKDYNSIMNSGEVVKGRHDEVYLKWVENVLTKKGVKFN